MVRDTEPSCESVAVVLRDRVGSSENVTDRDGLPSWDKVVVGVSERVFSTVADLLEEKVVVRDNDTSSDWEPVLETSRV